MDVQQIVHFFRGARVTIITTNTAAPIATGEVLDGDILTNTLSIKLTSPYNGFQTGTTVLFNVHDIVAIS
ncbi:MAG: hypothetical protein Q8930_08955 [Bacillota bacterium]|nr:hypothetical protein [Bacillota bacterium]